MTHIYVGNLTIIGSDNGLSAPSHYLNQSWNIVNLTLTNKLQWNSNIFIQENAFERIVCEMTAILPRPQSVNSQEAHISEMLIQVQQFSWKKMRFKCYLQNIIHFVSASMCWRVLFRQIYCVFNYVIYLPKTTQLKWYYICSVITWYHQNING